MKRAACAEKQAERLVEKMGFTETVFLFIFLPVSILLYLAVSRLGRAKFSNLTLVLISGAFYAWSSLETLQLFVLLNLLTWLLGNMVFSSRRVAGKQSNKWTGIAVAVFVAFLAYCKYIPVIVETINAFTSATLSFRIVAAPIGISFMMFEAISYIVDIHRGDATPGGLLDVFLFLSLFPKLVSGPIVLWKDFEPQVLEHRSSLSGVTSGLDRIIVGYAKKAILADSFGTQIQAIKRQMSVSGIDTPTMWLWALLFFFQLYYDFSGYSDIAIGLCEIFGFRVKKNFNYPYLSTSITEFWRRWHISLGTWFREYVYIPLGGNRRGNVYVNLFVVFLLTGIWHGANWTFVLWGVAHGILVIIERYIRDKQWYKRIPSLLKWAATTGLVFFLWILFMSDDLSSAWESYRLLFAENAGATLNFTWQFYLTNKIAILLAVAGAGAVCGAVHLPDTVRAKLNRGAAVVLYRCVLLLLLVIDILFVVNSSYSPFLYFQF